MKLKSATCVWVLGTFWAAAAAAQVPTVPEPTERTISPYDSNPACRERTVSGTDPACVIQDGPPLVRPYGLNRPSAAAPVQPAPSNNVAPPVVIVVPQAGGNQR